MANNDTVPVLDIQNLSVKFRMYDKGLRQSELQVISDISLNIKAGEIVAVAGSSGSGKSLLAHAVLGILPKNAIVNGSMQYCGTELTPQAQANLRGRDIALVPQSVSYLDPLKKVGPQVQGLYGTKAQQSQVFKRFELSEETAEKYPFQLSGGMARRILVSTAVISDAKLIIADEPTPGLSPEIAETTMKFFRELADEGRAVMLITHDIDLAFMFADRIAVFYAGTTVEVAPVADFIQGGDALRHPYSRALWNALPQNGFKPIAGGQPYAGSLKCGCPYAARCCHSSVECTTAKTIKMQKVRGGEVRCCHAT
ncbi:MULTISPECIES: ABC transporter ATP-binding protein [Sporomusa]|uniref:Nickel import system ATP-binding protein NikD n=1 Tax=Sporomusa sphaeroides DSM 2875 TaxID=1337886 RepID=A0ABM9W4Q0_9FIRM|nr:ABC transporter ATP-binding protein [Sporomusa sphaeroides]MCM0761086.1 ABC transporter ATP-binding protein [Sporomusa sphaeroides DSM 2875]OLS55902.1 putative D,D-dipeptide transport ATP-binding protein DdpD [Sporomusa sphaeroides DSM 2875]CVK18903.1 putative D,D-dipeptide transport ATP-binding protein DdpD [Sporomusa sphaeroides DSM 2875]HML34707.1 ABC transporter ATP-binding protein [Sporomusa sphaeroides]